MLSFEKFVKSMPPSLSELKVLPSFCFAFKIPDDRAVTTKYTHLVGSRELVRKYSNYQRLTPCKINEGTSPYDSEQAKSSRDSKRQQERPKRPTVLKAKPFWVVGPNICKEKLMVVSGSQRRPI